MKKKAKNQRTVHLHGPLAMNFQKLVKKGQPKKVTVFLHDLHDSMKEASRIKIDNFPPFFQPEIDEKKLGEIREQSLEIAKDLAKDFSDEKFSKKEIEMMAQQSERKVRQLLTSSYDDMTYIKNVMVPLNMSAMPTLMVTDNAFLMHDASLSSMIYLSPLPLNFASQTATKVLLIAGIILALISYLLALLNVKIPDVKPEKLTASVQRALRSPLIRRAFLRMIDIFKRAGATLKEKLAAMFDFLKKLYNSGALSEMLKEVLKGLSFADIFITITAIILLILSGGASAAAKAVFATAVFIVAMVNYINGYYRSQEA